MHLTKYIVFCLIPSDFLSAVLTAGCLIFAATAPGATPQDIEEHAVSLVKVFAIIAAVALSTWTVRSKLASIESTEKDLGRDIEHLKADVEVVRGETTNIKNMITHLPCEEVLTCQKQEQKDRRDRR